MGVVSEERNAGGWLGCGRTGGSDAAPSVGSAVRLRVYTEDREGTRSIQYRLAGYGVSYRLTCCIYFSVKPPRHGHMVNDREDSPLTPYVQYLHPNGSLVLAQYSTLHRIPSGNLCYFRPSMFGIGRQNGRGKALMDLHMI